MQEHSGSAPLESHNYPTAGPASCVRSDSLKKNIMNFSLKAPHPPRASLAQNSAALICGCASANLKPTARLALRLYGWPGHQGRGRGQLS